MIIPWWSPQSAVGAREDQARLRVTVHRELPQAEQAPNQILVACLLLVHEILPLGDHLVLLVDPGLLLCDAARLLGVQPRLLCPPVILKVCRLPGPLPAACCSPLRPGLARTRPLAGLSGPCGSR